MKQNANLLITIFDGEIEFGFNCCGAYNCKHSLCEIMPPAENSTCIFEEEHGSCSMPSAQVAILKRLKRSLPELIKEKEKGLGLHS